EVQDLKRLLDEELLGAGEKRRAAGELVREIANMEEDQDYVDRRGQREVADARSALEKLAAQQQELRVCHLQAEEWVGAVREALQQQRQDQLRLHEEMRAGDAWVEQLQKRVEELLPELQCLEEEEKALARGASITDAARARRRAESQLRLLQEEVAARDREYAELLEQGALLGYHPTQDPDTDASESTE
ncbi:unnamed protein product, partial [Prorocentrum cordatum]